MKFGIKIPRNIKETINFDNENGNTYWGDVIDKERKNVKITFKKIQNGEKVLSGYKKVRCFMNLQVEFDLRRKTRCVSSGNITDPLPSMSYSSVVSRESVRIEFFATTLNGLDDLARDIQKAYLNTETKERVWLRSGLEFEYHVHTPILIVRALYGFRSNGKAQRHNFSDILRNKLQFKPSFLDQDDSKYYTYIVVYVDGILIVDSNQEKYMDMLKVIYTAKKDSIHEPDVYLGPNVQKIANRCGKDTCWGISCE